MKIFIVLVGIVLILAGQMIPGLIIALAGFFWLGTPDKKSKKKPPQRTTAAQTAPRKKNNTVSGNGVCNAEYFENILRRQLPEYTLQRQVALSKEAGTWTCSCGNIDSGNFCSNCGKKKPADKKGQPLSIGLYLDGQLKLGIILCDKNSWNTAAIRQTMELCQAQNIPCLRFIQQFENDPDYVINRIRQALN